MEGYDIQQINGQLHIVIKNSWEFVDMDNCEVCVRYVPTDMTAQEVFNLFSQVGKILKLRLLLEFSGLNRGICYINYFKMWQLEDAVSKFNGFAIRGKYLQVFKSTNHRLLMIGNIRANFSDEYIHGMIRQQTDADFVYVYEYKHVKYCLIRYPKHQSAVYARRILISRIHQFGAHVYLRWYKK